MENSKVQQQQHTSSRGSKENRMSVSGRQEFQGPTVEKQVLTVAKAVEEKLDEEICALDDLEVLRERKLKKMNRWISLGHREYSDISSDKEFFSLVKASDRVVCHFYRHNWPCKVMDKHLSILAKQHIETRFVKMHAEKSPYLAEKLRIVVLPTLALVKNASVEDYVVGFDELGCRDEFSTEELEERLAKAEVIIFRVNHPNLYQNPKLHLRVLGRVQILTRLIQSKLKSQGLSVHCTTFR